MAMKHGAFVWYELMTDSAPEAEAFYKNVVGWNARDAGMPGMTYMLLSANGVDVAGMMSLPDEARKMGARPGWMSHVGVDDVDATAAAAGKAGASIRRPPTDIPGIGRFAILADPQGAIISLFRGAGEPPPPVKAGTPGHGGWHELHTTDNEAAFGFYSGLFGWTKGTAIDMGPMGVYQLFEHDGVQVGGMMNAMDKSAPPSWLYYFIVDAIDAAAARVTGGGGQIVHGPQEVPGGSWIIQCVDPQGVKFALVGPHR